MINQIYNHTSYDNNIINDFKKASEPICYYCKKLIQVNINKNDLTVDHKTPLSRGGKTVQNNLVISCLKCNQEKANMTEKEYKKFKLAQKKLLNSLYAVKQSSELQSLFNNIIMKSQEANTDYNQAEKELRRLENEIATQNYTSANSPQILNSLKNAIILRDDLKKQRDTLNLLHALVVPMKKQLDNAKIADSVLQDYYSFLKASCIDKQKESNIITIPANQDELSG